MATVTKEITRGASFGPTTAVADLAFVLAYGWMSCGSGDDHTLTAKERKLVQQHDPDSGDLELPSGRLNTRKPRPIN